MNGMYDSMMAQFEGSQRHRQYIAEAERDRLVAGAQAGRPSWPALVLERLGKALLVAAHRLDHESAAAARLDLIHR